MSEIIINEVITTVDLTVTEIITTQTIVINEAVGILEVVAGANVTVDNTNPLRPVVSASGGGGGGGTWGSITGTLSDQTDLQSALDGKEDTANKSNSLTDIASTTKFPVWAIIVTYITNALASFKTANFLDFTSSGQTQINNRVKIIIKDVVPSTFITGTTSETIMKSYLIPAGTFLANDVLNLVSFRTIKDGTGSNADIRIYINTTNSLIGATQILIFGGSSNRYRKLSRTFSLTAGNIIGFDFTNSTTVSDIVSISTLLSSATLNPSNNFYIITTVKLDSASNGMYQQELIITN